VPCGHSSETGFTPSFDIDDMGNLARSSSRRGGTGISASKLQLEGAVESFALVLPVWRGMRTPGVAELGTLLMNSTTVFATLLAVATATSLANVARAAEAEKPSVSAEEAKLTPEEQAEKDSRKACKVDICKAFHAKTASGEISCHVIKSWRKERIAKLVSKLKVNWPFDGVHCSTDLSVKREDLVKAMTEPKVEITFQKHTVTCSIESAKSGAKEFKFELTPTVKFENGKAIEAHANWGKIEAPTLVKSAMWTATAADNTVNLLSGTIVDEVNDFVSKRCDEVKDEWAAQQ
jgi:hypothetical protein